MEEKKQKPKIARNLNSYAKYSSLGFQMIVIILAGVFGGIKLDQWLNMDFPVFTVILSLAGTILAMYYGIKDLLRMK